MGDGCFAVNVLVCGECVRDDLFVEVGWGCDDDGGYVFAVEEGAVVVGCIGFLDAALPAFQARWVGIADGGDVDVFDFLEFCEDGAALPADADHAEVHGFGESEGGGESEFGEDRHGGDGGGPGSGGGEELTPVGVGGLRRGCFRCFVFHVQFIFLPGFGSRRGYSGGLSDGRFEMTLDSICWVIGVG